MSAFVTESKDVQWTLDGKNERVQPTVAAVIDEHMPAGRSRAEELRVAKVKTVLIEAIVSEYFGRAYRLLGRLLGTNLPTGGLTPRWETCCPNCGLHYVTEARREGHR